MFLWLAKRFAVKPWTYGTGAFVSGWTDYRYNLVVFEDYTLTDCIRLGILNRFLEGVPMSLNTKGGTGTKLQNVPCMILSNYHPSEIYYKVGAAGLEALMNRLEVVELVSSDDILYPTFMKTLDTLIPLSSVQL